MATFNFLIGNADAHGKNVSFLHLDSGRIRLAPLYDLVATAVWPDLDTQLAMGIGDEFDPRGITFASFDELADDLGLARAGFRRDRARLVSRMTAEAALLVEEARRDRWHEPVIDRVAEGIRTRADRVA